MKNNIKTNKSEHPIVAALVFDRFYGSGASAVRVILGRIFIAAAISFLGISYIFSIYGIPVNNTPMSVIAAGASVVFSLLFSAVKRRIAIPVITIVSGIVILSAFDSFWKKFSFFVDAMILEFDGRVFSTTASTIHPLKMLQTNGRYTLSYVGGVVFGSVILCIVFALIASAGCVGKPHILPSLTFFLLLCIPKLASERLFFGWQLIPLIALYAGMVAICAYYRDGLAIRHIYTAGGYRRKVQMDDRRFNSAVRAQSAGQRVASRGLHYSKYFSSVMSAVAIFTLLGLVLSAVFKNSSGIDYEPLYTKLQGLGSVFGSSGSSPFKVGAEADYFTSPSNSIFRSNNRLRLSSPSKSTKEIIRVTKPLCAKPIYLRGDIGIEFDGTSWSSPVTDEPEDWVDNNVNYRWLPAEVIAFADQTYLNNSNFVTYQMGAYLDINVEYLCDTDVIFVPAYDREYSVFRNDTAEENTGSNIFGDFSARRKTDRSKNEEQHYTAAVPYYTDASGREDLTFFNMACHIYNSYVLQDAQYFDYIEYLNHTIGSGNHDLGFGRYPEYSYQKYMSYVNDTYMDVPEKMKAGLDEFIESSGLLEEKRRVKLEYADMFVPFYDDTDIIVDRFLSAVAVSDYLKSNYTYSLDAKVNRRDPVMSFLNDTKSGHCALYASAMVLILREWGIPARYCTGFAASADLSMVTLRSKDLHAWVEVYLDGLGWVTFDPTAASIFGGSGGGDTSSVASEPASSSQAQSSEPSDSSQESSNTELSSNNSGEPQSSEPVSSQPDSSVDPTTHGSSENSDPGQSFTFAQILPYLLIILAILAVAAVIVLAVMAYIRLRKRAYKQVQSFHRERNSEYVYEKLLSVLRFCRLKPLSGEQPHKFFERAEQTLGCAICENYDLLERLAFGETGLDETERAQLGRTFDRVYKAAEESVKLIGRIRLRMLVLSKRV